MGDEYVQLGGYSRHLHCTGKGNPTVVLDAGFGNTLDTWQIVQSAIEDLTRACSYDRLNKRVYDHLPPHRTSKDFVQELHTLLEKADIVGPYVLVGHSLGGINMQLYAGTYPREVAGMVLVDSAHPDQLRRDRQVIPRRLDKVDALQEGPNPENLDFPASLAQARTVHSLGYLPLIVLTAARSEYPSEWHLTRAQERGLDRIWDRLQTDLAHLSSNSVHVLAKNSSHFIQYNQPEIVEEAIREVVRAAHSASHHLPSCGKAFEGLGGDCLSL